MNGLVILILSALGLLQVYRWSTFRRYDVSSVAAAAPECQSITVSFLVPAWNAVEAVPAFAAAFDALAHSNKELVICAGGRDGTFEAALKIASESIKVLKQEEGDGKQGALAKCLEHSGGEVIYLTDIDCRPDDDSLGRLLAPIANGEQVVVTGGSRPLDEQLENAAVLANWATERSSAGDVPHYVDGLLGRNTAVDRKALDGLGGFAFEAPTGTDYRLAQKLVARGHRIWFEPASEIRTEFAWPLDKYVRQRARWLKTVVLNAERPRQSREFLGAVATMTLPLGLGLLLIYALVRGDGKVAILLAALVAFALLNRMRYALEALPAELLSIALIPGILVNFAGTLLAGAAAALSLMTAKSRRTW